MNFSLLLSSISILLAQKGGGAGAGGAAGGPQSPLGGLLQSAPLFIVIFLAFYFVMIRPHKREQATRKAMLSELKKNDHVLTVGGIYGIVTNVRPEVDEVTIKVDESSNTKLRMTLSSISRVVGDGTAPDKSEKTS